MMGHGIRMSCNCEQCVSIGRDMIDAVKWREHVLTCDRKMLVERAKKIETRVAELERENAELGKVLAAVRGLDTSDFATIYALDRAVERYDERLQKAPTCITQHVATKLGMR